MNRYFDNLRLSSKLGIMIGVAILCLFSACAVSLTLSYHRMFDDRIAKLNVALDMATGLATALDNQVKAGTLSRSDAVRQLHDTLHAERFEGGNYLFVYAYDGKTIVHPLKPSFEGTDTGALNDKGGSLTNDFIQAGRSSNGGLVFYHYVQPDVPGYVPRSKVSVMRDLPGWGMVIGSGIYLDDLRAQVWRTTGILIFVAVPLLAVLVAVGLLTRRSIVGGLRRLSADMGRLTDGARGLAIAGAGRGDEVGAMARQVQRFQDGMIVADGLAAEQRAAQEARQHRSDALEALTSQFEGKIGALVGSLAAAATQLEGNAKSMTLSTDQAGAQARAVAVSAEQTTDNVGSVAEVTDALANSVREIAAHVAKSSAIAERAVTHAEQTGVTVAALSDGAAKIGTVVKLIQGIARQTNMLALNATIEAARAGEAGRGFAVVANEVKTLAKQTAHATTDIAGQIGEIQGNTQNVVRAIQGIGATIGEISAIAAIIAAAVTRQGDATQDIGHNVQQAAKRPADVTSSIGDVPQAGLGNGTAAREVLRAAGALSGHAGVLSGEVDAFLAAVKAA